MAAAPAVPPAARRALNANLGITNLPSTVVRNRRCRGISGAGTPRVQRRKSPAPVHALSNLHAPTVWGACMQCSGIFMSKLLPMRSNVRTADHHSIGRVRLPKSQKACQRGCFCSSESPRGRSSRTTRETTARRPGAATSRGLARERTYAFRWTIRCEMMGVRTYVCIIWSPSPSKPIGRVVGCLL